MTTSSPKLRLTVLGSTGSIGVNTLDVARRLGAQERVRALHDFGRLGAGPESVRTYHLDGCRTCVVEFRPVAVVTSDYHEVRTHAHSEGPVI